MVKSENQNQLMLARQLPQKSVALILAGGRGSRLKISPRRALNPRFTLAVSFAL